MNRHVSKKSNAVPDAKEAAMMLTAAMALLLRAESCLERSGWRGAAHGIHQAKARVESWLYKIDAELDAIKRADAKGGLDG